MGDWPVRDWAAVDDTELAAAAAVVARFRRRRRTAVAATLSLAVAVAISSGGFLPTTTSSLVPTDDPSTSRPVAESPSPTPTPDDDGSDAAPVAGAGGGTGASDGAAPSPDQVDAAQPRTGRRAPFRIPVVRTKLAGPECAGGSFLPIDQQTFCAVADAAQQKNGSVVLRYTACLLPAETIWTNEPRSLTFQTAREVDFAIVGAKDRIIWQWSTRQRFAPTNHTLTVEAGECYRWQTRWTGRLDDGTAVQPGTYTLRAAGRDRGGVLNRRTDRFELAR